MSTEETPRELVDTKTLSEFIFNMENVQSNLFNSMENVQTNLFNSTTGSETNVFNSMENVQSNLFNSIVGSENNVITTTVNQSNRITEKVEQLENLIKDNLIKKSDYKYKVLPENHLYTIILKLNYSNDQTHDVIRPINEESGLYLPDEQTRVAKLDTNITPKLPEGETTVTVSEKMLNTLLFNTFEESTTSALVGMVGGFTDKSTGQLVYNNVVDSSSSQDIRILESNIFGEYHIDAYNSIVKVKIYKMVNGETTNTADYMPGALGYWRTFYDNDGNLVWQW